MGRSVDHQVSGTDRATSLIMTSFSLLLSLCSLPMLLTAPLTEKEVQNRIIAVSKSKPELLRVAVSQADPHLLRAALTHAEPHLLEEALITALTTSDGLLLTLALTRSNSNLLRTALSG